MESKNKFTPGPWVVIKPESSPAWGFIRVAEKRHITAEGRSREEAEANTYLIAAAPDLYNALSLFVEDIPGGYSLSEWYEERAQIAWAALKKARGAE